MLHQLRTLRFRLAVLFVLIFGAIQLTLWIVIDFMLANYMLNRFDDALVDRTWSIIEALESRAEQDLPPDASTVDFDNVLSPFVAPDRFMQLRTLHGKTLFRTKNLGDYDFPFPDTPIERTEPAPLITLSADANAASLSPARRLRLVTMNVDVPAFGPVYVQVAADLAPIDHVTADLHRLLALFIFVSLVVAGMTAWFMTRKYMRPIGTIARRAREISASQLSERLPLPTAHSEITDMVQVINEMLERLQTEFTNQQRFIADASHELRTPLAVLMGEAHSLRRHSHLSRETAAFVATVEEETRQLLRTVEGFLILSRALSGRQPVFHEEVSVEGAVLRAIERCRRYTENRTVRIVPTFDVSDEIGEPHVKGDPDLLRSMVENLVQNAARYSPDNGRIEVHVVAKSDTVRIRVRDHGPGIPAEELERIFDLFHQVRPGGSAGVGLSIVKAVAVMHGGSVAVRNGETGGTEFVVRLPIYDAESEQSDRA